MVRASRHPSRLNINGCDSPPSDVRIVRKTFCPEEMVILEIQLDNDRLFTQVGRIVVHLVFAFGKMKTKPLLC